MGISLSATDIQVITDTLNLGAVTPDGTGNWSCGATNDDCILKLPVDRLIGQPDVIDVVPFESFTEFSNPSLLVFFFLANFDSSQFPINRICNRSAVTPPKNPAFYSRLYASVNGRNLSCANRDPALKVASCKVNSDCDTKVCIGGRCDVSGTATCKSNADCMPWEFCTPPTPNCTSCFSGCSPIGSCNDADPFALNACPATFDLGVKVATYCNGGECRRQ